ncbi:nuclear transport factor 2 family protein [Qipengyuania sediminis]|uniref:nuclear transport factor 2 family protein n=1 Tax=Qipengyuania sediminis TaxID=1532023 RepID=UPI0010595A80|nr:nuclear transport factor 2 family protein [Qipengyuania sediminis]
MLWGKSRRDRKVVERFVAALNAHDLTTLESLATEDFTYIDSWREGVTGRDIVLAAMRMLLANDPQFGIEVDRMDWRDPHVLMTGRVNSRQFGIGRRAVWQVLVREGRVAEYQAWAEGGPPPMSRMLAPGKAVDMAARAATKPALD